MSARNVNHSKMQPASSPPSPSQVAHGINKALLALLGAIIEGCGGAKEARGEGTSPYRDRDHWEKGLRKSLPWKGKRGEMEAEGRLCAKT